MEARLHYAAAEATFAPESRFALVVFCSTPAEGVVKGAIIFAVS